MTWIIGLAAALHVASFALMLRQVEPFYSFFYNLAWWSYIVFLAGLNHRQAKNSLIFDRPREFLWVFFLSTPFWLFFELYNLRLQNWHYLGIPAEIYVRWPGYFVAFGTVLPGILETETFLRNLGLARKVCGRILCQGSGLQKGFVTFGLLLMLAPLWRPDLFFPCVWLGLIFLVDPLLYWWGTREESFLGQAERGHYSLLVRFLATGMWCGVLWEFWNFWAGSKWAYTIPRFDSLRIFEMPLLGYFGFPPFALECYLVYRALRHLQHAYLAAPWRTRGAILLLLVFSLAMFRAIDEHTVRTVTPRLWAND